MGDGMEAGGLSRGASVKWRRFRGRWERLGSRDESGCGLDFRLIPSSTRLGSTRLDLSPPPKPFRG